MEKKTKIVWGNYSMGYREIEVTAYKTQTPGLIVTPLLDKEGEPIKQWYHITVESNGMSVGPKLRGREKAIEKANQLAGPDWTLPSAEIETNLLIYTDKLKEVFYL